MKTVKPNSENLDHAILIAATTRLKIKLSVKKARFGLVSSDVELTAQALCEIEDALILMERELARYETKPKAVSLPSVHLTVRLEA